VLILPSLILLIVHIRATNLLLKESASYALAVLSFPLSFQFVFINFLLAILNEKTNHLHFHRLRADYFVAGILVKLIRHRPLLNLLHHQIAKTVHSQANL